MDSNTQLAPKEESKGEPLNQPLKMVDAHKWIFSCSLSPKHGYLWFCSWSRLVSKFQPRGHMKSSIHVIHTISKGKSMSLGKFIKGISYQKAWGQANPLEHLAVIPNNPFQFLDKIHIRDYINLLTHEIIEITDMPQDVNSLLKSINLLHLDYSHSNTSILCSMNGFKMLRRALNKHFEMTRLNNESYHGSNIVEIKKVVSLCQRIVKLMDIPVLVQRTHGLLHTRNPTPMLYKASYI